MAYNFYYNTVTTEAFALVEQNIEQHEIVINERVNRYNAAIFDMVIDREIIRASEALFTDDINAQIINLHNIQILLRDYAFFYNNIRGIAFISDNGQHVSFTKGYSEEARVIWSVDEFREEIHQRFSTEEGISYISTLNLSIGEREDYAIIFGIPVRNLHNNNQTGVLAVAIDANILNFDNRAAQTGSANHLKTGVTTVIVDSNDKILATENMNNILKTYQSFLDMNFPNHNNLHEMRRDLEKVNWEIIKVIDLDVYLHNIHIFSRWVIVLTIMITLVFLLISYVFTRRYIGKISKIAQRIKSYPDDVGEVVHVDIDDKDELYTIARQFNIMIKRVNDLVSALKRKNVEVEEAAIRQKHAEIKALESQINPHFLFNTLDSINWMAIEKGEEDISNMLGSLGSLLRYSVSNIETIVLLEAEISWLRKYIYLQRVRFNYSFDCSYDIEEESLRFPIYKMLLQPIVENIIIHGFADMKSGGNIFVESYVTKDNNLVINIEDNGKGIPNDKLAKIREEINQGVALNSDSIGISNVINRLKIYYHGNAKLVVDSELGQGTKVMLTIPYTTSGNGVYVDYGIEHVQSPTEK
jgi:sensor histidine kinase YesM